MVYTSTLPWNKFETAISRFLNVFVQNFKICNYENYMSNFTAVVLVVCIKGHWGASE